MSKNNLRAQTSYALSWRCSWKLSSPPGVCAGVEGAVGVCGHGGGGWEHGRGSGGGPGLTQPTGQRQPPTVPQQPQPWWETSTCMFHFFFRSEHEVCSFLKKLLHDVLQFFIYFFGMICTLPHISNSNIYYIFYVWWLTILIVWYSSYTPNLLMTPVKLNSVIV